MAGIKVQYVERKTVDAHTMDALAGALEFYANPANYRSEYETNPMNGQVTDYPQGRVVDDGGRAAADALGILEADEERHTIVSQTAYLAERERKQNEKQT